jgi:hypothetical protein
VSFTRLTGVSNYPASRCMSPRLALVQKQAEISPKSSPFLNKCYTILYCLVTISLICFVIQFDVAISDEEVGKSMWTLLQSLKMLRRSAMVPGITVIPSMMEHWGAFNKGRPVVIGSHVISRTSNLSTIQPDLEIIDFDQST